MIARAGRPAVSVVMVAYGGGWAWVGRAVNALRENTPVAYEVVIVDNGGAEDRPDLDDPDVRVIRNEANVGFGPGSNQGVEHSRADVLCLLNPDVLVGPGWLPPILDRLADERVGAAFPLKLNVNGTLQDAGAFVTRDAYAHLFGYGGNPDAPEHNFTRDIDYGSAACMGMTRRSFESAGGFDPAYPVAYYEDADLCFRLRTDGLRNVYEPRSRVTHVLTVSADPSGLASVSAANRDVFLSRWASEIDGRPSLAELQQDARLQLMARDVHTGERVLVLDANEPGLDRLAAANPGMRVTLLADQTEPAHRDRLLAAGVEVVSGVPAAEWLAERAGHYSHVVAPQGERLHRLRPALTQTQPQARRMDLAGMSH